MLVQIQDEQAAKLAEAIALPLRRCYAADRLLEERSRVTGATLIDVLRSKLPDPGAVMSGDFGEVLVLLFEYTRHLPTVAVGAKKWRLKQDRTKAAPLSDLVHFVLPKWPEASNEDLLICTEVKAKATAGDSSPIPKAIRDAQKDRTSRLARTLAWLEERAIGEDLGELTLEHIRRFTEPDQYPNADKIFQAAAVVCASVLKEVLEDAPDSPPDHCSIIVLVVPELSQVYSSAYAAAEASLSPPIQAAEEEEE